jgi:hypothetical protein
MREANQSFSKNETEGAGADKPTSRITARDGRKTHGAFGSGILQAATVGDVPAAVRGYSTREDISPTFGKG